MIKTKSIKHLKRYRHILSILAKYGLKDLLSYIKLLRVPRPIAEPKQLKETAENLRLALQELGPTFIKGGQLLSSRSDILPMEITNELHKLLDRVAPVSYVEIEQKLKEQLGDNFNESFNYIEEKPLASASLAQVHKAQLKNGQIVVLKIQRPNIRQIINIDIDILHDFASLLQDRIAYLTAYNLVEIVQEFERNIKNELDFNLEGLNMQTVQDKVKEFNFIKIPNIYWDLSTKEVLCLEFIEGYKVTEKNELIKEGLDTSRLAWQILDVYAKQIYVDGFFQADPHIGNIFIRENGMIHIVDFGSIGKLDENLRREIATLVFHFIFKEGEQAAESLLRIGSQKKHLNFTALTNDVGSLIADYTTLPVKYFNLGHGLLDLTRVAAKHGVEVPANFSLVGKTFLLLDDIARSLDPDFDYNAYLSHLAPILLYERFEADYSPQKIIRNMVELNDLAVSLPSKINFILNKILKDNLHVVFKHEGLEKVTEGLNTAGFAIALSLSAVGLSFLAILSFLMKIAILSFMLGAISTIVIIYLIYKMLRKIKW